MRARKLTGISKGIFFEPAIHSDSASGLMVKKCKKGFAGSSGLFL